MLVDQRFNALRQDAVQVRSINDFTDSLAKALAEGEGTPSKELTRELLADGLRRALEIGGDEPKKRFLEALAANIHKFALQEQYSLSRVYPVEISSEYRNLQSFFSDGAGQGLEDDSTGRAAEAGSLSSAAEPAAMAELRRRVSALPSKPGLAAEELMARFREDPISQALQAADARSRSSFFAEVRLNLFRLTEPAQKELVELFPELKAEIVRLVDSMTQEIALWLDEERVAAAQLVQEQQDALPSKLRQLFQAVLSAPYLATFRHLGGGEKRAKEAFLLKMALCLRTCAQKQFGERHPDILELSMQLRRQFFYVEGYGELMEEWLQNRVKQLNEEFVQRASATLGSSLPTVLARLRQLFRPGRWMFVSDPKLEVDIISLFLDESFPRHVITVASIIRVLQKVKAYGGDEFHIYSEVARLPPLHQPLSSAPLDVAEAKLLEVLRRLPAFAPLRRLHPGPGRYLFGRLEVRFQMAGNEVMAQVTAAAPGAVLPLDAMTAMEFFQQHGVQEYPNAAADAVLASDTLIHGGPMTSIQEITESVPQAAAAAPGFAGACQAAGLPMPPPPPGPQQAFGFPGSGPAPGYGASPLPAKFGLDDDEI